MFTDIKMIGIAVIFVACSGLLIQNKMLRSEKSHLQTQIIAMQAQIEVQNQSILKWQKEAQDKDAKMKIKEKDAKDKVTHLQTKMQKIMTSSVSNNCEEAMSWGREQAMHMDKQ